jgi:predicted enzyme related to lactoylglutathione lyase
LDVAWRDAGETMGVKMVVNIDVDDLEKAIAFYTAALGLRLGRRLFEGSVAEMLGAAATVYLLLKPSGSSAVGSAALIRQYQRHWTPVHLDFVVDDLAAAVGHVTRCGAKPEAEIQSFPWGRLALMSDPFGHGFCLLQMGADDYDLAM